LVIPLQHVFAIEELTNISREYLWPDIYRPRQPAKRKAKAPRQTPRASQ
jgi:hypothetical protein